MRIGRRSGGRWFSPVSLVSSQLGRPSFISLGACIVAQLTDEVVATTSTGFAGGFGRRCVWPCDHVHREGEECTDKMAPQGIDPTPVRARRCA